MSQSYVIRSNCKEQRRFLEYHCEERSNEAISYYKNVEIAALPAAARNDNGNNKKIQIKMGPGPNL
jgi:hypothetical protein